MVLPSSSNSVLGCPRYCPGWRSMMTWRAVSSERSTSGTGTHGAAFATANAHHPSRTPPLHFHAGDFFMRESLGFLRHCNLPQEVLQGRPEGFRPDPVALFVGMKEIGHDRARQDAI